MPRTPSTHRERSSTTPTRPRPSPPKKRVRHGVVPAELRKRRIDLGELTLGAAGPGAEQDFVYRGGPVIHNPQVHPVFLGDWSSAANQTRATRLQQFLADLLASSYMNILSQYGCGTGGNVLAGTFISDTDTTLNDSDLQAVLQSAITGHTLPEPTSGSNICFLLYLDDDMVVEDVGVCEAEGAFGYHSHFQTTAGNECFYGVIPGLTDGCLTTTCDFGDASCSLHLAQTREQRQTQVTSHEFSEMITNPNVALALTDTGESWARPLNTGAVSPHENGDICNGQSGTITVGANTWTVQLMYSKWDDMNTNGATTCVVSDGFPLPSLLPAVTLVLDRSTYGRDEVSALGASATFTDAVYLVLDGYIPDELGLNAGNLTSPPTFWSFSGSFHGLSGVQIDFDSSTGMQLEDPSNFLTIQRITVPFNVRFANLDPFTHVPSPPGFGDFSLSASVTFADHDQYSGFTRSSETAEVELVLQADPFMTAGENWWVSNDVRVFPVTPATLPASNLPLAFSSTAWSGDPNTYVKNLLTELNTSFTDPATANTPFTGLTADEDASALELAQNDASGNAVFNFALARVHLRGDTATTVRTFFRLFISSSPDTTYDPNTTYRSSEETDAGGSSIAGTLIPLIGFPSTDMTATLPFFAEPRVDSTAVPTTNQTDPANVQTIPSPLAPAPAAGAEVYAYFGCYLDVNQPTPRFPLDPGTASTPDGPWTVGEVHPIPAIIMGTHACLVAQIAYDPDPIPPGSSPGTSDKLGQRNLAWVGSDNPGDPASHRIPATFDLRPTPFATPTQEQPPDELMIEWGSTPAGAPASIYLPQVSADEVLALADRIYSRRLLKKLDTNTIGCTTGAVTYVPIPPGSGKGFAGLLTVDLPPDVRRGQEFQIVVRRVTSRFKPTNNPGLRAEGNGAAKKGRNWRYVEGAFQVNIPVGSAAELLAAEENRLAVFKWKLDELPETNRWHPVLQRYVDQIADRVRGFGGNPVEILPSPKGHVSPTPHPGGKPATAEAVGKVSGLVFDRFGDFEGFTLETERGERRTFRSREDAIEDLVSRAWRERYVIEVVAREHDRDDPVSIILLRAPRP